MAISLRTELGNYFDKCLGERTDSNYRAELDEWALAERLEKKGYCSNPYIEFEKALCCPINKRRENECLITSCPSHTFCRLMRREGYIN